MLSCDRKGVEIIAIVSVRVGIRKEVNMTDITSISYLPQSIILRYLETIRVNTCNLSYVIHILIL
jgi:hypothetical protein